MTRISLFTLGLATHLLSAAAAPAPAPEALADKGNGRFSLPATSAEIVERDGQVSDPAWGAKGSETASVKVGAKWYIPVSIGTPPQSFLMLGDTGAPTLSVANTLEPKSLQGSDPVFNPNKSSTAKEIPGESYSITFVSKYHSSGPVFRDTVRVGDLTLEGMPIGLPNNHSATNDTGRSGNLGLSFAKTQSMTPTKEPTWLASIMPKLESGLFTVDWNTTAGRGSWDFGFIDKSKYSGDIAYGPVHSVDGGSGWIVQIAHGSASMYVTVDTGTSDSHVTPAIAKAYFSSVHGATFNSSSQVWTYPCATKLPDFNFTVGNTQAAIPSRALPAGSVGDGKCRTHLQVGKENVQKLIWGRDFIASMFVVFDWNNARVGFASKS